MAVPRFILSVDVEDYFQVEAFSAQVSRADWDRWPSRVVANTRKALALCDECGVKGTFFMLGWVADKFPSLAREVAASGHELACHSFWHRLVYSMTPQAFREDLRQARTAIEQAAGVKVTGYRAPSWSITPKCLWAFDILVEEGFLYDSSVFPIRHDIYGMPGAQRRPHTIQTPSGGLREYPPSTVELWGNRLPTAGGGYLRLFPFRYTEWSIRRLEQEATPMVVVYFHPWELDPEQPRIASRFKSRMRHYTNLHRMEPRLRRLMQRHRFEAFREIGIQPPGTGPGAPG
jgi:polysaccharide deacetylase family protein (PEP-CTERM system associated)